MSESEACVLYEVDGAEVLEMIGSRRDGVAETRFGQCRLLMCRDRRKKMKKWKDGRMEEY